MEFADAEVHSFDMVFFFNSNYPDKSAPRRGHARGLTSYIHTCIYMAYHIHTAASIDNSIGLGSHP